MGGWLAVGSGEWMGAYSDHDAGTLRWMETAGMSLLGRKIKKEDGKFWMPWREFCNYFDMVDVCAPSSSMKDLELDLNEDKGKVCGHANRIFAVKFNKADQNMIASSMVHGCADRTPQDILLILSKGTSRLV